MEDYDVQETIPKTTMESMIDSKHAMRELEGTSPNLLLKDSLKKKEMTLMSLLFQLPEASRCIGKIPMFARMMKALYELLHAPQVQYFKINEFLLTLGFSNICADFDLQFFDGFDPHVLVIYVDEFIIAGTFKQPMLW